MIITCPNCNKQFKIDNSLIPDEGRNLQCGSCNNLWFYRIEEDDNQILQLKEEIVNKNVLTKVEEKQEEIFEKKQSIDKIKINKDKKREEKIFEKPKNALNSKNSKARGSKLLSYFFVVIISFLGLIILIDTLKAPLINVFPELEIILFNLFETLKDIKLFIIDLL